MIETGVKNILVAYDGSQGSNRALEWAVALAKQLQAQVIVVTVVKPPEYSPSIDEVEEAYADGERYYQPLLTKVIDYGFDQGITIRKEILRGHPAESIVKYAYDQKADLIVTGTRGMGGFKKLIIGSVAQKVVTYAKVPVLVVK